MSIDESMLDSSISKEDIFVERLSREYIVVITLIILKLVVFVCSVERALPIAIEWTLNFLKALSLWRFSYEEKSNRCCDLPKSQFEKFISRFTMAITLIHNEKPYTMIITGGLNWRSSQ